MRLILLIILGLFVYLYWPLIDENIRIGKEIIKSIPVEINRETEKDHLSTLREEWNQIKTRINDISDKNTEKAKEPERKKGPNNQYFSVSNIELGDDRNKLEQWIGPPERSSINEYGVFWHTYHDHFQNFLMLAYDDEDKVAAIYTNHDLISSTGGIELGSPRGFVLEQLGSPIERIQKGLTFYQLPHDRGYDLFHIDGAHVWIFYDFHQNDTVTAIQIISNKLEQQRSNFYTRESDELREGFEHQLFDLTNATRMKHNVPILQWDNHAKNAARRHSKDMADNGFFSHTNLNGKSPFDRMEAENIPFSVAGENLAYGQTSSIFAHEGLMNSIGHRENILRADFRLVGIGVAFNLDSHPYYTQNFYSKRP
ncbi:CAP-associated domain-containing protein [Bacillus sp. B15-48]|uniref:CAP domain-containing protein n=1 Tax=Bacillus sp. B15-48 TaxID=1548601 RepID=UPI00193F5F93|nr:CAP-associated domain-containing protein [Bacillus sp. B15-48]MBM4760677.1 serine protease [Bacillus sp. B15-48]